MRKRVKKKKEKTNVKKPKLRIKNKKRLIIGTLVSLLVIGCFYVFYLSANDYTFSKVSVSSDSIPEDFSGFKIAFLSDLNLKGQSDMNRLDDIINQLNKKDYDMVLFGGDLYDTEPFATSKVTKALKRIKSSYGKFAVFGEIDEEFSENVQSILSEGGFEVLRDEKRKIYYKESYINLYGLDINTTELKKQKNYTITLAHYPDTYLFTSEKTNLQLSGHSGGGYIYVPFRGPLIKRSHATTYTYGSYKENGSQLIISNGLGVTSGHHYRLFEQNEVLMITLKST